MLVTRNEILRASNLGALSVYENNQDILDGWEFVSARDERVCKICGALDGKVFKFGDSQQVPPSGSHIGCRCTAVAHLRDTALMDQVQGGPRQTYSDWARENGIAMVDGGLAGQKASDAGKLNAA
jgi:SPP1 gp7 family putative phage head morphogenesis protein